MSTLLTDSDLVDRQNTATRIPVVLCLDTSHSMAYNGGFEALNKGLKAFYETCQNDNVNKYGFEVAIVTFGTIGVKFLQTFTPLWNGAQPPSIAWEDGPEGTPLAGGINKAIEIVKKRLEDYRGSNIGYYKPFIIILTDGQSTEDYDDSPDRTRKRFEETRNDFLSLQREHSLHAIAMGVGDESFWQLSTFIDNGKVLVAKEFDHFDFVFESISRSISTSSSSAQLSKGGMISPIEVLARDLEDEDFIFVSIEQFPLENL